MAVAKEQTTQKAPPATGRFLVGLSLSANAERFQFFEDTFRDAESLKAERARLANDWFLWRAGNRILGLPKVAEPSGWGRPIQENVAANLRLIAGRLNDLVPSLFPQYDPITQKPFRFVSPKTDLVSRVAAQIQNAPDVLKFFKIRRRITVESRVLALSRDDWRLALLFAQDFRWEIEGRLPELAAAGINPLGLVALLVNPPPGQPALLGTIVSFDEQSVTVRGKVSQTLPTPDVRVEGSREVFARLLSKILGSNYLRFDQLRRKEESEFISGPGMAKFLLEMERWLRQKAPIIASPGLTLSVDRQIQLTDMGGYRSVKVFDPIKFCFDPSRTKRHSFPAQGLHNFGPYSADTFPKKSPTILAVIPSNIQGRVETFLNHFQKGFPPSTGKYPGPYEKGFARHFSLANPALLNVVVAAKDPANPGANYTAAITGALAKLTTMPDVALVFIEDEHAELPDGINPYVQSKGLLMAHGIPVQEARHETIAAPQYSLQYNMLNIAVALYAKMGGIPWTVGADATVSDELVIGMGHCEVSEDRFSERQRFVGLTTVFKGDGNYLLANCSTECSYEQYPNVLKTTLRELLVDLKGRNGWKAGDTVRLIFHSFKPLKNVEVGQIVAEAVAALDPSIHFEHAFLTIKQDHPFKIVDHGEPGKSWSGRVKGALVPPRGLCAKVGPWAKLLCVNGPSQLKTDLSGLPTPILLELHKDSSFKDQWYLAGQVFNFTGLSWRSTQPSPLPVTLLYSKLIAELLVRLKHSRDWSPAQLNTKLRHSRWFL